MHETIHHYLKKNFYNTPVIKDNLKKFEAVHGPIKNVKPGSEPMMPPMNFGGPTAQA